MSGSPSSSSQHRLLSDNSQHSPNPLLRDPTTLSANEIGFQKVLEQDGDVGEQTLYQIDIENEELLRVSKRSELANKNAFLTRRWQTALVSGLVILALAGGIGK